MKALKKESRVDQVYLDQVYRLIEEMRRIIPTRGVVEDDVSVSNPEKYGFGRAAESISDGHGENVKVVIESVLIASKMLSLSRRDLWTQSKIFDRGRKQASHKLTMKIDGNEV